MGMPKLFCKSASAQVGSSRLCNPANAGFAAADAYRRHSAAYTFAAVLAVAVIAVFLLAAAAPAARDVDGKEYGLKLLAVSEEGNTGVTANLFLRIAPGTGNVFIESEPVTKLDTRISTKLAKEIACQSLPGFSERCDSYDFFYRIDANASIIGGPSAGAAAAALAIAAVDDAQINQSVAVTGTINSGGLTGQVGGLKSKIDAAAEAGLAEVLIPGGERYAKIIVVNSSTKANSTKALDLVEYGKSLGIGVVEVNSLDETLLHLTGRNYSFEEKGLEISSDYSEVMNGLASELCERSHKLASGIEAMDFGRIEKSQKPNSSGEMENLGKVLEAANNLTSDGIKEKDKGNFYSGASMCFGANVRHSYLSMLGKNISAQDALRQVNLTYENAAGFEKSISGATTMAGMQVRGTVKERLSETRQLLQLSSEDLKGGNYNDGIYRLAYAKERLGSAMAWNRFLKSHRSSASAVPLSEFDGGYNELLKAGCVTRLQDADEHVQYLDIYLPGMLKSSEELGPVYSYLREGDYSSCIYRASLAKARANAMLSALSVSENITSLVDRKLRAAKASIVRQTAKGDFPIISYSYYEYSTSLMQTDPPSALLFAEYALELSNLDIYLKSNMKSSVNNKNNAAAASASTAIVPKQLVAAFTVGFAASLAATALFFLVKKALDRKKKRIMIVKKRVKTSRH
ncbi:hypothetical protein HYY73_00205 [Candidatus Woesearchaeota archaeon]|nr:hypothetical protein [Candidatus Woesearchaeota archaeon]